MKTEYKILIKKAFPGFGILEPGTYSKDCSKEQIDYLAGLPKDVGYIINSKVGGKK